MFSYVNPIYKDFIYSSAQQLKELEGILSGLISRYQGVMPSVDFKKQIEIYKWDKKNKPDKPRLSVSWTTSNMNETLYERLEEIFKESVLDGGKIISRRNYKRTRNSPSRFVGFDGNSTGRIRGFPLYEDKRGIIEESGLSREERVFWVARGYPSVKEAQESMRKRNTGYWFYDDGKFLIELRTAYCKEIEFIDTALRVGVALNGSYDSFDRSEALSLAQKQLVKRGEKLVQQEEVVGLESLIEDIKFRQFFATIKPKEAKALGVTDESVLLVGVPGTGKSLIAATILWDGMLEKVPFIPVSVTELLEASYLSDKKLDSFFVGVRDLNRRYGVRPMLWCDDLESAFLNDVGGNSKEMAATQSSLLNHLQGVSKDYGVRISGATNYPEKIDPRFLEFGRISYMFHIPIPKSPEVLAQILRTHVENRGQTLADNVSIDEIANKSLGYTPRMLVNLVNEAGIQAAKRIFGKFSSNSTEGSEPLKVRSEDYSKADYFLRTRTNLNQLKRRDEEIADFVEKHNFGKVGFR